MKWLLIFALACGGQPAKTKRYSEYTIGGSLAGVIGASLVMLASPSAKTAMTFTIAGFGAIAVGATVAYVRADFEDPPHVFTPEEKQRIAAWDLTKQAEAAARKDDCTSVKDLSVRVAAIDADFQATVFLHDVAIDRCMHPPPPPPKHHK